MKAVLAASRIREEARKRAEEEQLPDYEEEIIRCVKARKHQPNISFFAFTATPKYKPRCCSAAPAPMASRKHSTTIPCARPSRKASSSTCSRTTPSTRPTTSSSSPSKTTRKSSASAPPSLFPNPRRHRPPPRIPRRPHLRRRHRPTRRPQTRRTTRGPRLVC